MLEAAVRDAVAAVLAEAFPQVSESGVEIEIEIPREKSHGDFATNVAMSLARPLKQAPRGIAEALVPIVSRELQ